MYNENAPSSWSLTQLLRCAFHTRLAQPTSFDRETVEGVHNIGSTNPDTERGKQMNGTGKMSHLVHLKKIVIFFRYAAIVDHCVWDASLGDTWKNQDSISRWLPTFLLHLHSNGCWIYFPENISKILQMFLALHAMFYNPDFGFCPSGRDIQEPLYIPLSDKKDIHGIFSYGFEWIYNYSRNRVRMSACPSKDPCSNNG